VIEEEINRIIERIRRLQLELAELKAKEKPENNFKDRFRYFCS
jgi:FtsZ-binding cell division protein ZapB